LNRTWLIFIAFTMLLGGFLVYRFIWLKKPSQMGPPEQSTYQPLAGEGVITILYTGNTQSYLEPCGCYPGQSGGIARRATLVERIRAQDKSTLLVDAGGIFEGTNPLDQLRGKVNMEAMKAITYDAILLSPTELQFGDRFLGGIATELQLPFISTNDPPLWQNGEFVQPVFTKKLKENEFLVLGASYLPNHSLPHLIGNLRQQVAAQKGNRRTVILLSALNKADNRQIADQLKEIDLIISMKPKARGRQYETVEKTMIAYCTPQGETLGNVYI